MIQMLSKLMSILFVTTTAHSALRVKQMSDLLAEIPARAQNLTSENCATELNQINYMLKDWMPDSRDQAAWPTLGKNMMDGFFRARLSLHNQMDRLDSQCLALMRKSYYHLRAAEDIAGLTFYKEKQIKAEEIDFAKQPVPIQQADQYRPYHLNGPQFKLQKGDLLITKGVSVISSTISSFPSQPSLFSHVVFVYQEPFTQNFGTIESYIGKGVDFYSIKDALLNENARILVLRPKDQQLAQTAHDYMYQRVKRSYDTKTRIAYDYLQDLTNNEKMNCGEIAYDAFKTASSGQFVIPHVESQISVKNPDFLKGSGLSNGNMMLAADMELDPRFEVVLDWTDYRLMRDSWRKDSVMREVLRWVNEENYILKNNFKASMGKLIWKTRETKYLWPIMAKIAGIPKDFEKEVPAEGIAMMANLKGIGGYLVPELAKKDEAFFKEKRRWMSLSELQSTVNDLRLQDLAKHKKTGFSKFHSYFKPGKTSSSQAQSLYQK